MANDRLDVIIFGASGFTGKYTVYEGVKLLSKLKWGIAGRSKEKLEKVLKEMGAKSDSDLSNIPIIIADINDEGSLLKMAERAKVIVNCCGPYRFYGEPVVKACINAGAHHVDVSGEPQYMERMQLEYNELARAKGVYIISACGFDSIPIDLGMVFYEKHFDGEVNAVETYLQSYSEGGDGKGGAILHYGTWASAVYGLAHANELRGLRSKLFTTKLPDLHPKLKSRRAIHKSEILNKWCLPFLGSDSSVVMRSQRILFENEKKRPVQLRAYIAFQSLLQLLGVVLVGAVFALFSSYECGRKLLLNYPRLFSFGYASHEGPSEESQKNAKFSITFNGNGWPKTEKLSEPTDIHADPPTKTQVVKVSGTNPGYGATCVAVLLSAITILNEHEKMPDKGGVLPPGAAFAKTNMISELCNNGFKFELISSTEKEIETEKSE